MLSGHDLKNMCVLSLKWTAELIRTKALNKVNHMPIYPICTWLFIRSYDMPIQIISDVDRDERLSTKNLQSLWLREKKKSHFCSKSLWSIFPLTRLSVIFPHLSGVYFAPSIHKPPYKADFSDCLIAQHRCSLCLAWGQLREWDGVTKIVEKCHPGMKYWWTERPCLFPLPWGVDWESRSWWATKRKAKTNTNLQERRQTESGKATILSIHFLWGIVIFSLPEANHNQILLHFTWCGLFPAKD